MGGIGKLLVSLVVGGVFLYLAVRNVRLEALRAAFAQLDPRWLVPAVILSLLIQVFRAWRWQLELRPLAHVPFGTLWVVASVAYMAINLLPIRMGEVVRPWLLSRRTRVSFSNVVGNLLIEKTFDSAVIVFYILLGLLTTRNLPHWVRTGALVPAVAFVALATLVVLLWWRGEHFVEIGAALARSGHVVSRQCRPISRSDRTASRDASRPKPRRLLPRRPCSPRPQGR